MPPKSRKLKAEERLTLLQQAEVTGNVAEACRSFGVSRPCFYKWRARYERDGLQGLQDQPKAPRHHPRKLDPGTRDVVVRFALMNPWLGCHALSPALLAEVGREVSGAAIHRILKERGLETVAQRIKESTKLLARHPHLRVPETWDYLRQRNLLLSLVGIEGGGRGYIFQAAFLPYPKVRPSTARDIPEGDTPWAFVMIDGSSGYAVGRIWVAGGEPFWELVIDEIRSTCELLRLAPKLVQIHPDFLFHANMAQIKIKNVFKSASVQMLMKSGGNVEDWVQIFQQYLNKYWRRLPASEATSINLQHQFLAIMQQFNVDRVNDGFPNFGESPEDVFWNRSTK